MIGWTQQVAFLCVAQLSLYCGLRLVGNYSWWASFPRWWRYLHPSAHGNSMLRPYCSKPPGHTTLYCSILYSGVLLLALSCDLPYGHTLEGSMREISGTAASKIAVEISVKYNGCKHGIDCHSIRCVVQQILSQKYTYMGRVRCVCVVCVLAESAPTFFSTMTWVEIDWGGEV